MPTTNYNEIINEASKNFCEKKMKTHNEMVEQLNKMLGDDIKRPPKIVRPDSFPYKGDDPDLLNSFSAMQNSFYNNRP